eukprot:6458885-Alexandrium_andersonii.AAC.1
MPKYEDIERSIVDMVEKGQRDVKAIKDFAKKPEFKGLLGAVKTANTAIDSCSEVAAQLGLGQDRFED